MFQYSPILGRSSIWDPKYTFSKSCLPDRSKTPDLGKIVFLNHPFSVKNGKKVLSKINKIKSKLPLF